MLKSKKAQISDTMSWMVATIIIILILSIPIFLIKLKVGSERIRFERFQDPISAKSISGYLLKNYEPIIKSGIDSGIFSGVEKSVYPFLVSLARNRVEGWTFTTFVDNDKVYQNASYAVLLSKEIKDQYYFKDVNKEIMLEFWMRGQEYD